MRHALLPLLLALPLISGCVLVVSPPLGWFRGDNALTETVIEGEGDAKILVLSITGFISDQPSDRAFGLVREESTVARVAAELKQAADDPAVRGLVLRINSPGGGVTASDEIYHLIREFRRERRLPVVAALGSLAASGGYYVALGADHILAHPTTVTGSIGVIMVGLNIEGLMDKIGVTDETFKSGPHKDLLSPMREASEEERRIVQDVLDGLFERFVGVVTANRPNLDADQIDTITDGRVFAAETARTLGLVDDVGRLEDAIDLAKRRAGLSQASVISYSRPGESAETVYSRLSGGGPAQVNILPIDLPLSSSGPRFLYLWRPGATH